MVLSRSLLSNYYHIFLILQELHKKLPWYNLAGGLNLSKGKAEKKKLYGLIKQKNYLYLNNFSVEVLLQVLQKLLRELNEPLLSSTKLLYRRWLDIGDYVKLLENKQVDSDIRPDLVLHIARFIHTHYSGYNLLLLQHFLGMIRSFCGEKHPKIGFRFNSKMLSELCIMFAPDLVQRPKEKLHIFKYSAKFWNHERAFTGHYALFFIVVRADEIFATDEYAILQNLSPKLLTHRLPLFVICDWNPKQAN